MGHLTPHRTSSNVWLPVAKTGFIYTLGPFRAPFFGADLYQFAIFIDAGYLYAEGGKLVCGTSDRLNLELNFEQTVSHLVEIGQSHSGVKYLRTYWYDAATDASPNPSHLAVASIPGVKLRLGRLSLGKQKGVDSRIVRDLIVLARDRAISAAYVVSGDEDIRDGVVEAQDCGISVALVGIAPLPGQYNQARSLVQEADAQIVLDSERVSQLIKLRQGTSRAEVKSRRTPSPLADIGELASRFVAAWANSNPTEVSRTISNKPRIPREVDRDLLAFGVDALGGFLTEAQRRSLRDGFGAALDSLQR